ncbi:MAG TPA: SIS domain-containing protein [Clostridia bacterium]|nr:SIS domain-containing protein [Clostridia bacterium]
MTFQEISKIVKEIKEKKAKVGGIKEVYFVACGGSLAANYPAKFFLESEAKDLKVGYYTSNEFVHATPNALGKNSIAIVSSHQGTTPESVEAAKLSQEKGASTICFTFQKEAALAKYGDYVIGYEFGEKKDSANEKDAIILKVAVEILNQVEGYDKYDAVVEGFGKLDNIIKKATKHVEARALEFAEAYKDEKLIYTMASGSSYGAAHIESICIFMEMQWINSSSIHSGEYFHGPFEITDANVPFIMLMSEGRTRALDERALAFLSKYGKKYEVLDAKELGINEISDNVVEFFNPFLFSNVLGVYNKALAAARKHPLSTRRYMWKLKY